jgi:K+-sensing histidine kinase KdpD
VERSVEALAEVGRWRRGVAEHVHRPALLGERLLQAARAASASVPDRSLDTEVRDRPLEIRCDAYALERALTNLLVGVMQQSPPDEQVEVSAFCEDDIVILELSAEGGSLPIAELSRLVGQLRGSVTDPVAAQEAASLRTSQGQVRIVHGPVMATTGPSGTYLILRTPVPGSSDPA